MFRFNDRAELEKIRQRNLCKDVKMDRKPSFRELLSIMFAQYLIILPIAFGGIIIFMLITRLVLFLWGA